jgi:hypothetical protein
VYPLTRLQKGVYGPDEIVKNKPWEGGALVRETLQAGGGGGLGGGALAPGRISLEALSRAADDCAKSLQVSKADKDKILAAIALIKDVKGAYDSPKTV